MKNKIAVIGLGYVGLPLALEFGKKNSTIGYDLNLNRIKSLSVKIDTNKENSFKDFKEAKYLKFTNDFKDLKYCNYFIITVPTPIYENKKPNLKMIIKATKLVAEIIKKNDMVIYESTVYPGLTDEICIPLIEKISNLKCNKDFYCGYSPERINPGDKINTLKNITKIVSASNNFSLKKIYNLYSKILKKNIHAVSSIKVAEAAKVIENTQRDLNIAFMNELTQVFDKLNINTEEVLRAASTKWNFINFKPGFVGGHCISVDPYYLAYKAKKVGINPKVLLSGRKTNDDMHLYVYKKLKKRLNDINTKKLNVLILGYTFKENCSDYRNTKIRDLNIILKKDFKSVQVFDPLLSKEDTIRIKKVKFINKLYKKKYDIILIAVAHNHFKKIGINKIRTSLKNSKSLIFDLKYLFDKNETDLRL